MSSFGSPRGSIPEMSEDSTATVAEAPLAASERRPLPELDAEGQSNNHRSAVTPSTRTLGRTGSHERRRNQACQRCKKKKMKCDTALPRCRACETAGQPCTMIDLISKREYERAYVAYLERRIRELETQTQLASVDILRLTPAGTATGAPTGGLDDDLSRPSPHQSTTSQYVGDSSEINFTQLIANLQARTLAAKTPKLAETFMAIRAGKTAAVTTAPNELPSSSVALELIRSYLFGHHLLSPFLSRGEIMALYQVTYQSGCSGDGPETRSHDHQSLVLPLPQDMFRLNMVFAIGSVSLVRKGLHQSQPLGYYVAAMHHLESISTILGIEAAQNLLFLAEFTMLQDTGCSIWDICRICTRTCLLLDLHRDRPNVDQETAQAQRLVFWACYSLDRVASTTLGRPYAISDLDISVPFPSADYVDRAAAVSEMFDPAAVAQLPPENMFFVSYVKLRRLSSEISTYFYRLRRKRSSAEVTADIIKFLTRLKDWRSAAAQIPQHDGILCHETTWLDYLVAKETLSLARAAINHIVVGGESLIPKDLRDLCLSAGLSTIETYTIMFLEDKVDVTRMYFHVLFSASVSCLYCILAESGNPIGLDVEEFDLAYGTGPEGRVLSSLDASVQVLVKIASNLPDLGGYSAALEIVVSQMCSSKGAAGTEPGHQIPGTTDCPTMVRTGCNFGGLETTLDPLGDWPSQAFISASDWQNVGTEMWQFVEPDWPDSSFNGDVFGAVAHGATFDWTGPFDAFYE
ncbi:hypothetical protein LCI18_015201 [Fusarium solani-melongenae]|uniref:Uncharacterized protein n=1 Tax=Fusarium solani subsp. cucurbitae TaxID=2747967 RepID=A0ACD3ZT27_FUSSC|nr:hypothetical protein LCI18_015201 [Fusarium solani-melongenae]